MVRDEDVEVDVGRGGFNAVNGGRRAGLGAGAWSVSEYRPSISEYRQPVSKYRRPVSECRASFSECRAPFGECRTSFGECRAPFGECRAPFGECRASFGECRAPFSECRGSSEDEAGDFYSISEFFDERRTGGEVGRGFLLRRKRTWYG